MSHKNSQLGLLLSFEYDNVIRKNFVPKMKIARPFLGNIKAGI